MSLLITSYHRDARHEMHCHEVPDAADELGGFESCRHNLWGSLTAQRLGLTLLCTLRTQDLYAEGADLEQLSHEAHTILQHLAVFVRETPYSEEFIRERTLNLLKAIARAQAVPQGGVVIW